MPIVKLFNKILGRTDSRGTTGIGSSGMNYSFPNDRSAKVTTRARATRLNSNPQQDSVEDLIVESNAIMMTRSIHTQVTEEAKVSKVSVDSFGDDKRQRKYAPGEQTSW